MKQTDYDAMKFHELFINELCLITPKIEISILGMSYNKMCSDLTSQYNFNIDSKQDKISLNNFIDGSYELGNFVDVFSWSPSWTIHVSNYKNIAENDWNLSRKKQLNLSNLSFESDKRNVSVIDRVLVRMATEFNLILPGISHEYYNVDNMLYERFNLEKESSGEKILNAHCWIPVICVEHENSCKDWTDELVKLIHIQSRLKVVIGYCAWKDRVTVLSKASQTINSLQKQLSVNSTNPIYVILGPRNKDIESVDTDDDKISKIKNLYQIYKFENDRFVDLTDET